ncbi:MAG: serine hydrolase [Candidatus Hodarchaeales archaeon]|jgi:WD40 repeat protein
MKLSLWGSIILILVFTLSNRENIDYLCPDMIMKNHHQSKITLIGKKSTVAPLFPFSNNFGNLTSHDEPVYSVAFSPDEKVLASSGGDGSIHLWNISDGTIISKLQSHFYDVITVDFSSNGKTLASAGRFDKKVNIWDIPSKKLVKTWNHTFTGRNLAFSPINNNILAIPKNNSVIIKNITTGVIVQTLIGHTGLVTSIAFSPDGSLIASGSTDNTVKLWNVSSGVEVRTFSGHSDDIHTLAFSANAQIIATGGKDSKIIVWDVSTGGALQTLISHEGAVNSLEFYPLDPAIIVSGGGSVTYDSPIKFWNITSGKLVDSLIGHQDTVNTIAFSHNGKFLASGSSDRVIKLWGNFSSLFISTSIDYWPTSTPEDQNLNSSLLDQIYFPELHSLLVLRNGKLVHEKYYTGGRYQFTSKSKHALFSVTKSFTSTLIGIALDKGFISNINQKVLDFFPEKTFCNMNSLKEAITIEHLLTMTTGLDWYDKVDYLPLARSLDMVQFTLDRPMRSEPGSEVNYNSGASHLLAVILQKVSGLPIMEFALKYLFEPLAIEKSDISWMANSLGQVLGGNGLYLTPRNMAKLGQLYLNNGSWNGQDIVSTNWITVSTSNHGVFRHHPYSITAPMQYGYHWWPYESMCYNGYYAQGSDGQFIFVIPRYNLVIVCTSGVWWRDAYFFADKIFKAIIPDSDQISVSTTDDIKKSTDITQSTNWLSILPISLSLILLVLFRKRP